MRKAINNMLTDIVGEDLGQKIFEANFPDEITGYKPGKVLTLGELRLIPVGTIIHIYYTDEDGELRENGFQKLSKDSEEEWSAGAFPFPIDELTDDQELKDCDNSGWTFTIREALVDKKGEYAKRMAMMDTADELLEEMKDTLEEIEETSDKVKKKELKKKFNALSKQLNKMKIF